MASGLIPAPALDPGDDLAPNKGSTYRQNDRRLLLSVLPDVPPGLALVVGGTLVGVPQWLVLRRHVAHASWSARVSPSASGRH